MSVTFTVSELCVNRSCVARAILESLPEWFGIPDAREKYIARADSLPMLIAHDGGSEPVGFLSLLRHTPAAAEAYVLGVRREHHGRGCGRALFTFAEQLLARDGAEYLTVKTLGPDHPDQHYAATRRFYKAIGFEAIEVFENLWGEGTPCLLMIKRLKRASTDVQVRTGEG